jgi:hypothetical protein
MQGNRRKNGSLIDSSHWVGLPLGSASLSCPASGSLKRQISNSVYRQLLLDAQ